MEGTYLGMALSVDEATDKENAAYFSFCAQGEFRLQRGRKSGLLRYPPTTACPWSRDRDYDWVAVEGRGAVHSYSKVHHAIQPAFRAHVPYLILLVDLDTQLGQPTEHEALRIGGNLVDSEGNLAGPGWFRSGWPQPIAGTKRGPGYPYLAQRPSRDANDHESRSQWRRGRSLAVWRADRSVSGGH